MQLRRILAATHLFGFRLAPLVDQVFQGVDLPRQPGRFRAGFLQLSAKQLQTSGL